MDTNAPKEKEAPNTQDLQKRERPSISPSKEILVYDLAEQDVNVRMAKDIGDSLAPANDTHSSLTEIAHTRSKSLSSDTGPPQAQPVLDLHRRKERV